MEPPAEPKPFAGGGFMQQTHPNAAPRAPFSGNWLAGNWFPGGTGHAMCNMTDAGSVAGANMMFRFCGGAREETLQASSFRGFGHLGLAGAHSAALPSAGMGFASQKNDASKSESERLEQFLSTVETLHHQLIAQKKQNPFQHSFKPRSPRAMAESVAEKCMELYFKLVVEYADPSVHEEVSARTNFVRLAFEDLRDWLSRSSDGLFHPEEPSGVDNAENSGSDSYDYEDYGSQAPSELVKQNEAAAREHREKGAQGDDKEADNEPEDQMDSGGGAHEGEGTRAQSPLSFDSTRSFAAVHVHANANTTKAESNQGGPPRKTSGEAASTGPCHEREPGIAEHASSPVLPHKRGEGEVLAPPQARRLRSKVSISGGGWSIKHKRSIDETGLPAVDENGDVPDEGEDEDEKDFSTTTLPNLANMMQRVNLNKGNAHNVVPHDWKGHSMKLVQELSFIVSKYSTAQSLAEIGKATSACLYYLLPSVAFVGLYLFDPSTGKLTMPYSKGFSPQEKEEALETALQRHPGKVMRSRQMMKVDDTATADQRTGGISSERGWIVRSRLWLPIVRHNGDENSAYGAFGLASAHPNAFTKDHLKVLSLLCNVIEVSYAAMYARMRIKGRFCYVDESAKIRSAEDGQNALLFVSVEIKDRGTESVDRIISAVESSVAQTRGEIVAQMGPDQLITFVNLPAEVPEKSSKELRACMCALSIREGLMLYSDVANFRMGVHTGEVIECKYAGLARAGRTGTSVKAVVTLADLARFYGVEMVCSEAVIRTIDKNQCPMGFVELDSVALPNRAEPFIRLYHVMRREQDFLNRDITGSYAAGLKCYRQGQWETAISHFQPIAQTYPPADVLMERSQKYWKEGAPSCWDGVWKAVLP